MSVVHLRVVTALHPGTAIISTDVCEKQLGQGGMSVSGRAGGVLYAGLQDSQERDGTHKNTHCEGISGGCFAVDAWWNARGYSIPTLHAASRSLGEKRRKARTVLVLVMPSMREISSGMISANFS